MLHKQTTLWQILPRKKLYRSKKDCTRTYSLPGELPGWWQRADGHGGANANCADSKQGHGSCDGSWDSNYHPDGGCGPDKGLGPAEPIEAKLNENDPKQASLNQTGWRPAPRKSLAEQNHVLVNLLAHMFNHYRDRMIKCTQMMRKRYSVCVTSGCSGCMPPCFLPLKQGPSRHNCLACM